MLRTQEGAPEWAAFACMIADVVQSPTLEQVPVGLRECKFSISEATLRQRPFKHNCKRVKTKPLPRKARPNYIDVVDEL